MGKKKKNNIESDILGIIIIISAYLYFTNPTKIKPFLLNVILVIVVILIISISIRLYKDDKKRREYLNSGIDVIDRMDGIEFESLLLAHFENIGYKGRVTKASNDYGADLVLKKDGKNIVVQAKRYSSKVGIAAVQQIIAAKAYYKAEKCIVVSNNYFTKQAINLAKSDEVELWDRDKLIKILNNVNGKSMIEEKRIENQDKNIICKKCGAKMVLKSGRYGKFYGCSNYPKCNNTEKII